MIKELLKKNNKNVLILLTLFLIITPIVLTPWIHGNDGAGYYAYVRSAFIDGDLDLKNEKEHYNQSIEIKAIDKDPITDKYYSQYPIGTSLLWAPYFLLGHTIAVLTNYPTDGYSLPYVYMICFGSALHAFIGIILIYILLKKYFDNNIALLSVITIWLASNLFYYMYFESSMSHANSFFLSSLFLFIWVQTFKKRTLHQWIALGAIAGLLFLVRYQNIIFLFLPFVEVISSYLRFNKNYIKEIKKHIISALIFFLVISPQFILLKIKHDSFLVSYSGDFNLLNIPLNFFKVLFSPNHGLFYWTPILFFGLIGLIFLYKKNKIFSIGFLGVFLFNLIIISGWSSWNGAQSFGHRMFINCLPFFMFGFATFLSRINKKVKFRYIIISCLLFIFWNFGLMIQYGTRMISVLGPVHIKDMFYNNIFKVPKKLFSILYNFIFNRGVFLK
jgi:hypothetical protein